MGSTVHFPGDLQALECRPSFRVCFTCPSGPASALVSWICWIHGLVGGREDLESRLLISFWDGKFCAVPRKYSGTWSAGFLVSFVKDNPGISAARLLPRGEAVSRRSPGTGVQAWMQGLFYLVPLDQLFPWSGSAGFLYSLVEKMIWNLGFSNPTGIGRSLQFPGNPQAQECRPRFSDCFTWSSQSRWALFSWFCWFPGLVGGREGLESAVL